MSGEANRKRSFQGLIIPNRILSYLKIAKSERRIKTSSPLFQLFLTSYKYTPPDSMLNRYGPTRPLDLQTKGARPVSVVGKPKTPAPTFDGNLPRCNLETTACLPSGRPRQHHTPQPAPQSRKQFTRYDTRHTSSLSLCRRRSGSGYTKRA